MGKIISVTMSDIARVVGVSQTTVSLAFRRAPKIPESTRERIFTAARRLGYRPHAGFSALMAQVRAHKPVQVQAELAAITFWRSRAAFVENVTWQQQWEGACARARQLGYALEEFWLGEPGMTSKRLVSVLQARNIEGAILFPLPETGGVTFPFEQFSVTAIGYTVEEPLVNRVVTAHFEAVLIALGQLRERGYRRIGLVLDEEMSERGRRGWQGAFLAYGMETGSMTPDAILSLSRSSPKGALFRWARRFKPDAILYGGSQPISVLLDELRMRAPKDIGVVRLSSRLSHETCAGIDGKWWQVGAAAVDLLVGQLHRGERGLPDRPMLALLRGEWIQGDSVRPLRSRAVRP